MTEIEIAEAQNAKLHDELEVAQARIGNLEAQVEAERAKVSNLRFALANIVDKDMTIHGHFVGASEIAHAHIIGGRRALTQNK